VERRAGLGDRRSGEPQRVQKNAVSKGEVFDWSDIVCVTYGFQISPPACLVGKGCPTFFSGTLVLFSDFVNFFIDFLTHYRP